MKKWICAALVLLMTVTMTSGCSKSGAEGKDSVSGENSDSGEISGEDTGQAEADFSVSDADMFTERDYEADYNDSSSVHIELDGSSVQADSDSVQISDSYITLTEEAVYVISGTLEDGMIIVGAPDTAKIQIVLSGADITSETSAPIYILEADKVFVTLAPGTENTLSNGGTYEAVDENNIDSVIFSKQDLTLNGSGSLTVSAPAGHGIVSNDDLVITGGTYSITAASHGLKANDSVRVTGETDLTLCTGKDGIHAENDEDAAKGFVYISDGGMQIEAEGDGISAGAYMYIVNGTFDILAGGGSENGTKSSSDSWGEFRGDPGGGAPGQRQQSGGPGADMGTLSAGEEEDDNSTSMKGIKSTGKMLILNGSFSIDSADDSIHSNVSIAVQGGDFEISSGDDAFHADESLTVADGTIYIAECYEGLEALDVAVQGGEITLTASDDGLNAAGGTDSSGTAGGRDGMFGGGDMGRGGMGEGGMASSNGSITISGGTLYINASGDGIDANGSLTISGGYTVVTGPTQGDTATLDYDTMAVITGGTFIGTGASGMAQTFSDSEQGVIAVSVGEQSAGTEIRLEDADGNEVITCTPELSFAVVILSSPEIESGENYTITVGEVSGEFEAQ